MTKKNWIMAIIAVILVILAIFLGVRKASAWNHQYWNYTWSEWSECVPNKVCKPDKAGFVNGKQTKTETATCLYQPQYEYPPNCENIGETRVVATQTEGCRVEVPMCEPEPTPEATPEATPVPPKELTQAGAPSCPDGSILTLPIAFRVMRQGSQATLTWYKTGGDLVNIYYRELGQANWTHAVGDVPNVDPSNKYTISGLVPSVGYIFAIEQHQGCASGQLVQSVVVDSPASRLFTFSYWTWSK